MNLVIKYKSATQLKLNVYSAARTIKLIMKKTPAVGRSFSINIGLFISVH